MEPLVVQFQGFVTDLTTVEKRSIIALTEIARDALRTHPHLAPSLATVLTNRILQAPADLKLPVLYLLDSISKTIGEPYKSYFAASLPEIYVNAYTCGNPALQKPLDKLLTTWAGVFPVEVLDAIRSRLATVAPAGNGYPGYAQPQAPYYGAAAPKPMVPDARLTGASVYPPSIAGAAQPGYYGGYTAPATAYPAQQPAYGAAPDAAYPPVAAGGAAAPAALAPDLFSLLTSGALAAVTKPAEEQAAGASAKPGASGTAMRFGAGAKGKPATTEFSSDRIKEHNPAAVDRLLTVTERTKSNFLDRLFLRRQKHESGMRTSRLWYVDLDTWMASTTSAAAKPSDDGEGVGRAVAAAVASPELKVSVPADDEQTHCALSGEKFEQFWDEDHQEWRYKDARRLTAEEAASYGLEEGAIVLVSAFGGGPPQGAALLAAAEEKKEEGAAEKKEDEEEEPARKRVKTEK